MAADYRLDTDLCDDPELIDPELDPPFPQDDPFPPDVRLELLVHLLLRKLYHAQHTTK